MKESDDIANLFRHFGGQPGQYQEISRANEARQSRERWPLLASIEADQAAQRPPVDVAIHQDAPQAQAPQPAIPPVAVQPVAPPPDPEPAPQPAAPHAGRIEPHLSPDLASPPPSGQAAEKPRAAAIVPPRPGGLRDRMRPLAALAALAPEPAAGPEAPAPRAEPEPVAAPKKSEPEPEPQLHALFTRLARPAAKSTADKGNASLLERLNRL
ncbi:cellulose biosynthesis protein BcsP [Pigmentiphaga sp.]|uniref:cellulose biosynthesis protein BcsP n=1 Tax=Pigmentiphaga sp. TaxID=1977564 RepID=UPI00128D2432|nr:cellulose biosynthesis protein BcsP [Pigmentiphaga sp.]MPS28538.1 hypothetical protein [Alcaligenaceae bacterium SAGV5]MPT58074.1 hypothetical protein [Alcaligenaceae bacterium]